MRLTAEERQRLDERVSDPRSFEQDERKAEAERLTDRRLWAAVMLTVDLGVCRSIVGGNRVLARQLDATALRRALRGRPLSRPETYLEVRPTRPTP